MLILIIGLFNARIHYSPDFETSETGTVNKDLVAQLRFLDQALENGADKDMQRIFPEGFVFIHALYALSWCELAMKVSSHSEIYKEAKTEASESFSKIGWATTQAYFPENISPPRGIFYRGWRNYVLSKMAEAGFLLNDEDLQRTFRDESRFLVDCFSNGRTPFLDSYPGMAWPADNLMAAASVANYNKLNGNKYSDFIEAWVKQVKGSLDSHGLIPHRTFSGSTEMVEGARGSSQSLMLSVLAEVDAEMARSHFQKYKELFLVYRVGLPGILEYPKGKEGSGDIDSGPVLFGVGGSASIVGIKAFNIHGDFNTATGIRNSVEAFGLPVSVGGKKRYLLGKMPMADAFIAWSHASFSPDEKMNDFDWSESWKAKFLIPSWAVFGILLTILGFSFYRNRV
ncbi:MAG: hypothetical protein H6602_09850 [Flavobacteriales bacterium]|nr:hypothetical protein [Flavobacteriales bacterium]